MQGAVVTVTLMIQPPDLIQLATATHHDRLLAHAAVALSPRSAVTATTTTAPTPPATADVSDYFALHDMIRRATRGLRLATTPGRVLDGRSAPALASYWAGYAAELHTHHTVEDTIFFPALIERDPALASEITRIDTDHAELDELISMGNMAFAALQAGSDLTATHDVLRRLERLMGEHLDFEDAVLLPRIARLFDQAEYDDMHDRAVRSTMSLKQAAFVVPFVGTWIAPAAWRSLWDKAPLPMRVVYRLTRRRHARLARAAFGPVLDEALPSA